MKNVLVTGGAGFIGSNFVRLILQKDPAVNVFNLDVLAYSGSLANLEKLPNESHHIFIKGDICDERKVSQVIYQNKIDTIVHFAAETHVDRSILGPKAFVDTNINGTFTLVDTAKNYWMENKESMVHPFRFHHVSTDEVFGTLAPNDSAWTEDSPYQPRSPYSASKAAGDHLVRSYGHTYGFPYTITNCSNNYGPFQFPEKLVPLIILNALEGKPLPVYGDGTQIRDWLHVQDHCEAILLVLKKGSPGQSYNIGGGNQPTNLFIVNTICELVDELSPQECSRKGLIQFVKDRLGHDHRYAMNSNKIIKELNWTPLHTLDTGLRDTVKWYINHPEWVASIRKQAEFQSWIKSNYEKR